MDTFELVSSIVDLLRGKDQDVWHEILERTLNHDDPYSTRASQVKILDVLRSENIEPENLVAHLQSKKCYIDDKLLTAFDLEKKREHFSFLKHLRMYNMAVMIQFDPANFGVNYDTHERSPFGADANIGYQKVVDAALKYGFRQPDLIGALYFRNRFWDAHKYTEGTTYYIACKPIVYAPDQPPIIPVLDYDRYKGWAIRSREVGPEHPLDMSYGTGQGEHFESTFVFELSRQ